MIKSILFSSQLKINVARPLRDLAALFNVELLEENVNNVILAGELCLKEKSSSEARLVCVAVFKSLSTQQTLVAKEDIGSCERGEFVRAAKVVTLKVLQAAYAEFELPWGVLLGVRPGKLVHKLLEQNADPAEILTKKYLVSQANADFITSIAKRQREIVGTDAKKIGIYIGIPYCPSRCLYCSFSAGIMPENDNFQQNLCNLIEEDLLAVVQLVSMHELEVSTVYVGGGTPTSLNNKYFKNLMLMIKKHLNLAYLQEFTVEAGRPDCFTREKLMAMQEAGVTRISINPQTMQDKTLNLIGRKHTVKQVCAAYELVRKETDFIINMDLIIGLPNETLEDVVDSLNKLCSLNPDNLTVHTLTLKKGAPLFNQRQQYKYLSTTEATEALNLANSMAGNLGMNPYYLYRQHYMLGHLANVGYAKVGQESIYNIQMMEERHTILGIGPSSATKIPAADGHHLTKYHMPKDFSSYNINFQEHLAKRAKLVLLRYGQEE